MLVLVDRLEAHPAVGRDPRLVRLERWMHGIDVVQNLPRAGRGASASLPGPYASEKAGAERGEYHRAEDGPFHLRSPEHRARNRSRASHLESYKVVFSTICQPNIIEWSSCARLWQCATYFADGTLLRFATFGNAGNVRKFR
jgi:hypothetical protein